MALIGKIRERSTLLLIVMFMAIMAFVLAEVVNNLGRSSGVSAIEIGEFAGQPMDDLVWRYSDKKSRLIEAQAANFGGELPDFYRTQIEQNAWDQMIKDSIYNLEIGKIGIGVCSEELNDILHGENIHELVKSDLWNQMRQGQQFNKDTLLSLLPLIQARNPGWLKNVEGALRKQRTKDKYHKMIAKGLYVSTAEADYLSRSQSRDVNVEYVYKPFSDISDSLVTVTDEALRAYYDEHKSDDEFVNDSEFRSFKFVKFDVKPSQDDEEAVKRELEERKEAFEEALDDSLFVVNYGESNASVLYPDGDFGHIDYQNDSVRMVAFLEGDTGAVYGPYKDGDFYKLIKVRNKSVRPEVEVELVFVRKNGTDDLNAKAKADSLFRLVQIIGKPFAEIVDQSDDYATKDTDGKSGWFSEKSMGLVSSDSVYREFCFKHPVGTLSSLESDQGYYLVRILNRRQAPVVKLATVDKKVRVSDRTRNSVYNTAAGFYSEAKELGFDQAVEKAQELQVDEELNIRLNNPQLIRISEGKEEVYRWLYNVGVGDISQPIICKNTILVPELTAIRADGMPKFEDVKDQMKPEVVKLMKTEYLTSMIRGKDGDLGATSTAMGVQKQLTSGINAGSASVGSIPDTESVGISLGLAVNETSDLIKGKYGVYQIKVVGESKQEKHPVSRGLLTVSLRDNVSSSGGQQQSDNLYNGLLKIMEVKDRRMIGNYKTRN